MTTGARARSSKSVRTCLLAALTLVAAVLTTCAVAPAPADAAGVAGSLGSNGQHRRAFYNFGHNPNTFGEVTGDLDSGANALEPDVMSFTDAAISPSDGFINAHAGPSGLFMYHDHVLLTTRLPDTVESWLEFVHAKAVAGKNVALIAFDVKSAAATTENGPKLLQAVHDHLNYGGVNINVIFSVGSEDDSSLFSQLIPALGPREGVMIDADNDPVKIYNFFHGLGADGHIAYGDGSLGVRYGFAPNVLRGIEEASWVRAGQVPTLAIPYAYPIDLGSDMDAFITAGADGLIPDVDFPLVPPVETQSKIAQLAVLISLRDDVYEATVADDPLHSVVEAYGLEVSTRDIDGAGTDSNITFTLTGCNGTSSVTIDTEFIHHMEDGNLNFVTLPSKDLGQLSSLTLSSDGSRGGFFGTQEWAPDFVQISSAGWGIPFGDHRTANFANTEDTVDAGSPKTRALGGWGNRCASLTAVASSTNPSTYGQPVTFTSTVAPGSGSVLPTGTVEFLDGATPIGSGTLAAGTAAFTTGGLSVGSHPIRAHYLGGSIFAPSVSSVVSQTVRIAPTATTLSSATNPSVHGQPVLLSVTTVAVAPGAGTPTGQVQVYDGAVLIGTGTLAGGSYAASFSVLSTAVHSLTAKYLGNGSFAPSISPLLRQVVLRAPTDLTLTAQPAGTSTFGSLVTFTAKISVPLPGAGQPSGPVVFAVDGAVVQTKPLSPAVPQVAVATASLGAGPHVVTATYQGDIDFLPSSATLAHSVVCTVTITGVRSGAVRVTRGSTCLTNATVKGSIVVQAGASLDLQDATVSGSIVADQGPDSIRICGSSIGGSVHVRNAQGLVVVGDPGPTGCALNTVGGALILTDNTHGVRAVDNTVGTLIASDNSGPGPYPGDPTLITGGRL